MPIYESETTTNEDLVKLRKTNRCRECGARLSLYYDLEKKKVFIACWDWYRSHHEGIEREASRYEQKGIDALNIKARREIMEQTYGKGKTQALTKWAGVLAPSEKDLTEILDLLFPKAPEKDKKRALLLCLSYKLNPLANHVFLIPFKDTWVLVQSIKAKRLLASRRGSFSYVDNTPRVMSEDEQKKIFGEVQPDRLWAITKLKDTATGAEAVGYGFYLNKEQPYGIDKGNSQQNMAFIRSESQAIDRLRPSEMPTGVEVMPEEAAEAAVIEAEYKVVDKETGELSEPEPIPEAPPADPEPSKLKPSDILEEETALVTKEETAQLKKLLDDSGMTPQGLGEHIREFHPDWGELKAFGDLKKWQLNMLLAAFKKGKA